MMVISMVYGVDDDGDGRTGGADVAVSGVLAVECGLRASLIVFATQLIVSM